VENDEHKTYIAIANALARARPFCNVPILSHVIHEMLRSLPLSDQERQAYLINLLELAVDKHNR
jgi:hypothetical protein